MLLHKTPSKILTRRKSALQNEGTDDSGLPRNEDVEILMVDPRFQWLEARMVSSFRMSVVDYRAAMVNDDNRQTVMAFMDSGLQTTLFTSYHPTAGCIFSLTKFEPSAVASRKVLLFVRIVKEKIAPERINTSIAYMDIQPDPLQCVGTLMEHVQTPLINIYPTRNATACAGVRKELLSRLFKLRSAVHVMRGEQEHLCNLPLAPPDVVRNAQDYLHPATPRELIHQLEGLAQRWSHQCTAVLVTEPDDSACHGSLDVVQFWDRKCANLTHLYEQLHAETTLHVTYILSYHKSTFSATLDKVTRDTTACLAQTQRIVAWLQPLRPLLLRISSIPFEDLTSSKALEAILHFVYLLWRHSGVYSTTACLTQLLQMVSRDIVKAAVSYLCLWDLTELKEISTTPEEVMGRLTTALGVLGEFKFAYFAMRARMSSEEEGGLNPSRSWRVQHEFVFRALDAFLERCLDLLDILETEGVLRRVCVVDIGEIMAVDFNAQIRDMHASFTQRTAVVYGLCGSGKALDSDDNTSLADLSATIRQIESALCAILGRVTASCTSLAMVFKVLDSFDVFLERPRMANIRKTHEDLVSALWIKDLREVMHVFAVFRERVPDSYASMYPPVSAYLYWCYHLLQRGHEPKARVAQICGATVAVESLEACRILKAFTDKVTASCYALFDEWCDHIPGVITAKMAQLILTKKDSTGAVDVNEDATFVQVQQEVQLLTSLHSSASHLFTTKFDIPAVALSCSVQNESCHLRALRMSRITIDYNGVLINLPEHEYQLVEQEMACVDTILEQGVTSLRWGMGHDIDVYVAELSELMGHIMAALNTLHAQGDAMAASLKALSTADDFIPLLATRQTDKTMTVEEFLTKYDAHRQQGVANIVISAELHKDAIDKSLAAINVLKKALGLPEVPSTSPEWTGYVSHVSVSVQSKLVDVAFTPIHNLYHQMSSQWLLEHGGIPLLDIKLVLQDQKTVSCPQFRIPADAIQLPNTPIEVTVESILQQYVMHSLNQTSHFSELDGSGGNYLSGISTSKKLIEIREVIGTQLDAMEVDVKGFVSIFNVAGTRLFSGSQNIMVGLRAQDEKLFSVGMDVIERSILSYNEIESNINDLPMSSVIGCLRVDAKPVRQALKVSAAKMRQDVVQFVHDKISTTLAEITRIVQTVQDGLATESPEEYTSEGLRRVLDFMREVRDKTPWVTSVLEPLAAAIALLHKYRAVPPKETKHLEGLLQLVPATWEDLCRTTNNLREQISTLQDKEGGKIKEAAADLEGRIATHRADFCACELFRCAVDSDTAYDLLNAWQQRLEALEEKAQAMISLQDLFEIAKLDMKEMVECREDLRMLKQVWDTAAYVSSTFGNWMDSLFVNVDIEDLMKETNSLKSVVAKVPTKVRTWGCFVGLEKTIKDVVTALPLIRDIRSPAVKDRHWIGLWNHVCPEADYKGLDEAFTLSDFFAMELHNHTATVGDIVDCAGRELLIERTLAKIFVVWETKKFEISAEHMLCGIDEIIDYVNDHAAILQAVQLNKAVEHFADVVSLWISHLGHVEAIAMVWSDVQKQWLSLAPIFQQSDDVRVQLRVQYEAFQVADENFRNFQKASHSITNVIQLCTTNHVVAMLLNSPVPAEALLVVGGKTPLERFLQDIEDVFVSCEKGLIAYLEQKRRLFPRFYFLSAVDLLHVLSHSSQPPVVMQHVTKIVEAIDAVTFAADDKEIASMRDREGEVVAFTEASCVCGGTVEGYLHTFLGGMRNAVKQNILDAHNAIVETPRFEWMVNFPAQVILALTRIAWTMDATHAFESLEDGGNSHALVDLLKVLKAQVASESEFIKRPLSKADRKMLVALITVDVHSRDIIAECIERKVEGMNEFQWQSQLKMFWSETTGCSVTICDATFQHGYEYVGNCGCLVITPLTDRCYITLTQALRLCKGGAAAGPAGTGKTETTKDLARVLGVACFVFNCSEQMDYRTLGGIFKGLAMSGSWGCFDEFNRISVDVLSVVATQVKCVLEGCRRRGTTFKFEGEELDFNPSVGVFITMNPGYLGRTELPENIKALFRPCAMVVPDVANICEIMLAAEGFLQAKSLAVKFVTLYRLASEVLSLQEHYDWGLRAIKSVLVVAGKQKQNQKTNVDEKTTLFQALLDANFAKLVKDDQSAFLRILRTLFLDVQKTDRIETAFDEAYRKSLEDLKLLLGEGMMMNKARQLAELMEVRHSVYVLGNTGGGKSALWRSTIRAMGTVSGERAVHDVIEPNAISSAELYGYTQEATREWRDGVLSRVFRDFSVLSKTKGNLKVIVLDGIIDSGWIESMNTVMDDNKILTLSSNERISLTSSMRLLFEITHLHHATPATVSRAGILYLNPNDISWNLYKERWVMDLEDERERTNMDILCDKYLPLFFEFTARTASHLVPMCDLTFVQSLLAILDGLRGTSLCPSGATSEAYEKLFLWACVWAFGSCLSSSGITDKRAVFTAWFKRELPVMKLGESGTVFDYILSPAVGGSGDIEMTPWPIGPQTDALRHVSTLDGARLEYFLSLLVPQGRGVMLVGPTGVGKTATVRRWMGTRLPETFSQHTVMFTGYTDSKRLQTTLEGMLERRSGRQFGPPGRKHLLVFLEDLNLQNPDGYGTQSALSLLRQHIDYGCWYDMEKLTAKEILQVQYIAAYNPKAGNGFVLDRLQRHFVTFAQHLMCGEDMYTTMLAMLHAAWGRDKDGGSSIVNSIVLATVDVAKVCSKKFPPTADKFHYTFSLREVMRVTRALCEVPTTTNVLKILRVWVHECRGAFSDRFVSPQDVEILSESLFNIGHSHFAEVPSVDDVFREPLLVYRDTDEGIVDAPSHDYLLQAVAKNLESYNDVNPPMDLVLFNQALEYVICLKNAIIRPGGHALIVGVGGSGKRSLSRLAAHSCGHEVFSLHVTSQYTVSDFIQELSALFMRCGVKRKKMTWLLADVEVVLIAILECVHLFLTLGDVSLFIASEDRDDAELALERQLRSEGNPDYTDRGVCWKTFLAQIQENLHIVLCSSGGSVFRTWSREFPSLIGEMHCVWVHPWPQQALMNVANRFLRDIDVSEDVRANVACHMSFVFNSVEQHCQQQVLERVYNYVTPKSFLSYIQTYHGLWTSTLTGLREQKNRLALGVAKLTETQANVSKLRIALQEDQVACKAHSATTDVLLEKVGREKVLVQDQNALAQVERLRTRKVLSEVNMLVSECEAELAQAQPIVQAALEALDTLDRGSLTELKTMSMPPPDVHSVTACVMVLMAPGGKIPRDRSWNASKKMMSDVSRWMKDLKAFDPNTIPQVNVDAVMKTIRDPSFTPENVAQKSVAASCLCAWVTNMVRYHEIRILVRPKEDRMNEAQDRLFVSTQQQNKVEEKVNDLQKKLDRLVRTYVDALEDKRLLEEQANKTQHKLNLAERLVESLHEEHTRWHTMILQIDANMTFVTGDTLLTSDVTSYAGPFSSVAREKFVKVWRDDIKARAIPCRENFDPITDILINEAAIATWFNEGLPRDRFSTENAAIATTCKRWPLFIDPQTQASKWIRAHAASKDLVVVKASETKLHTIVRNCIRAGVPCMIEGLPEKPDPSLYALFAIEQCVHGRALYFKFGDELFPFDENMQLYFQTALPNPHYRPEVHAQLTVINFTVTEIGLTEQLLSTIVKSECPEAEIQRLELIQEMNDMTIELQRCEDSLLLELVNARGDVLENAPLITTLEKTKTSARQIGESMIRAKEATDLLSETRLVYRPAACRGALMYFLMTSLRKVDYMYQYSLESFQRVFVSALERTPEALPGSTSVPDLTDSITRAVYAYVNRGLMSNHKLVFAALLCLSVVRDSTESITSRHIEFLVRAPPNFVGAMPPALGEWITERQWAMVHALAELSPFETLPEDLHAHHQWRVWAQLDRPEQERMPTEWKTLGAFHRLLVLRCLCPDRIVIAMEEYIGTTLGPFFTMDHSGDLMKCVSETSPGTPILFVLSSGVDPGKIVEALGVRMHFVEENETLLQVSLGQGQEENAERALRRGQEIGAWVFLHNVHLMRKWLVKIDNIIAEIADAYSVPHAPNLNPNFRLFISAEPSEAMPITLLQRSMKLVNQPPAGLQNNFVRAFQLFSHEPWEASSKHIEHRTILIAMCLFHGLVVERRRFGPLGWNKVYPFGFGDLQTCVDVLSNYLEDRMKVPWEDLRFVFGEIMYGGHITDRWDRRLCNAYLGKMLNPRIIEGGEIIANICAGTASSHAEILSQMGDAFPVESPHLFGLSTVADASSRTVEGANMFRMILEAQPYFSGGESSVGMALLDRVVAVLENVPDALPIEDVTDRLDDSRTPYQQAFIQECERMNKLLATIQRDVADLEAALNGLTSMSSSMQTLADDFVLDKVPASWVVVGYMTCRSLPSFLQLIVEAYAQLSAWVRDLTLPRVFVISYFLTPASFLSAVLQDGATRNGYELDQTMLTCDVTRKLPEGIDHNARDGSHVYGLYLEGARWDVMTSALADCRPKDLFTKMPVITIRGTLQSKFDATDMYECPVYRTAQRGQGYVTTLHVKTKEEASKWVIAGVALLLDPTL